MDAVKNSSTESNTDPRWQLVERIVATDPFRRSARFRDLLRYMAEKAIANQVEDLTETRIGIAVFNKPPDYSPTEDSTVRVHVRQLRLKLHEYFHVAGQEESLALEIPKGGFVPVFKENASLPAAFAPGSTPPEPLAAVVASRPRFAWATPALALSLLACIGTCIYLYVRLHSLQVRTATPWPLSYFANSDAPTAIVTADVNYGMVNLIQQRHRTLQEYLTKEAVASTPGSPDHSLLSYIDQSSLTSSADAVIAAGLSAAMAGSHSEVSVRSARDLRPRDLDFGNFIFLGSPTSNPWVSEFLEQMNFEETEETATGEYQWKNKAPRPGEQQTYTCLKQTGTAGADYADIAFLPGRGGKGFVMVLQGCQQEGTEGTLLYLSTAWGRESLLKALGLKSPPSSPVYFEALIRTQVIAGAPNDTSVVAARMVQPRP